MFSDLYTILCMLNLQCSYSITSSWQIECNIAIGNLTIRGFLCLQSGIHMIVFAKWHPHHIVFNLALLHCIIRCCFMAAYKHLSCNYKSIFYTSDSYCSLVQEKLKSCDKYTDCYHNMKSRTFGGFF